MSFFIGKAQKIFQARFQRKASRSPEYKPYFSWAILAVLYASCGCSRWLFTAAALPTRCSARSIAVRFADGVVPKS